MKIGITGYGMYVPSFRIKIKDIASVWGKNYLDIEKSLRLTEKAVASSTEDSLTMAYEAGRMALNNTERHIDGLFFGTESPPYAVNPASTILGEMLGIGNDYLAYDTQFACKAATGALISALGLVKSSQARQVMVVASDKATARPHDSLEYTAGSGAVALILGNKDPLATIEGWHSYSSDTPDFWRREGIRYPSHGGRFTGKPSYFRHIAGAVLPLLKSKKITPSQFDYAVFHMPNGAFPVQIAKQLGFSSKQIEKSLVVSTLGNSYTASGLMGLVSTLEHVKPGNRILFASYGSGAGSDAFILKVTPSILKKRIPFTTLTSKKTYIDYATYLKFMKSI